MKLKKTLCLMLCAAMTLPAAACGQREKDYYDIAGKGGGYPPADKNTYAVDCGDFTESDAQQERWLSVPESRLVINPFQYSGKYNNIDVSSTSTQSQLNNSAALPLNLGWLHPEEPQKLPNFVSVMTERPDKTRVEATDYTTSWRPDRLECEADFETGTHVVGRDYFYDEKTVVRDFVSFDGFVTFWGTYDVTDWADWADPGTADRPVGLSGNTLYVRNPGRWYNAALTFNGPGKLAFYNTVNDLKDGANASAEPGDGSGIWCYTAQSSRAVMSVSIDVSSGGIDQLIALSKAPFEENRYMSAMTGRTDAWNELLSRVPSPVSFALDYIDSEGTDAALLRRTYYKSWTLLLSGILPASPETGYPYPQVCCGKPSMWSEGHPDARYSAAWESLFGIQFLSMVDPDTAWDAFLGYMSLVEDNGMLAGESLPSNKATTAWVLYNAKPDAEKLKKVYPALESYMNWRLDNPRWILSGAHDDELEKDMDFSAAALVDIRLLVRVCGALAEAEPENAAVWTKAASDFTQKADEHYRSMCDWFFPADRYDSAIENLPKQYYYPEGKWPGNLNDPARLAEKYAKARGASLWVFKCLWADQPYDAGLVAETGKDVKQILLDYYDDTYNAGASFVGMSNVKYDEYMYTAYGLIKSGRTEQAARMIEAGYRDVSRTRFLAEQYQSTTVPSCDAACVRPSLFGAEIVIDSVLIKNGYFYHDGGLNLANLFDGTQTERGVTGIRIDGKTYDLEMKGAAYTLRRGDTVVKQASLSAADGIVRVDSL